MINLEQLKQELTAVRLAGWDRLMGYQRIQHLRAWGLVPAETVNWMSSQFYQWVVNQPGVYKTRPVSAQITCQMILEYASEHARDE